jgi:hypothetical protein
VFGGKDSSEETLGDFYAYLPTEDRWIELTVETSKNETVTPRAFHQSIYFDDIIYTFGGQFNDNTTTNNLTCFDTSKLHLIFSGKKLTICS